MKIAFTGTRKGMTIDQWATLGMQFAHNLTHGEVNEWHCGDAIGADHQANQTVATLRKGIYDVVTHGHPCNIEKQRAYDEYDRMHEIAPPLVRNRRMVDQCDLLIAAPYEYNEVLKGSGTWATIRYARARHVRIIVVWPNGSATEIPAEESLV